MIEVMSRFLLRPMKNSPPGCLEIQSVKIGTEVYHNLKKVINTKYGIDATNVGDEGGFAPNVQSADEALEILTEAIAKHDRDHWAAVFAGSDACVAPVLAFNEVLDEPHNTERDIFYDDGTGLQPRPAPRFSRSVPDRPRAPGVPGADTEAVLRDWVYSPTNQ